MKIPVIIPAHNEADYIGTTLQRLDKTQLDPWVVVNASSDETYTEAQRYAEHVFNLPEQGKLPAIQFALKHLGKQALDPVLLLDADAYPVFSKQWSRTMCNAVQGSQPTCVSGLNGFWGDPKFESLFRTARLVQSAEHARRKHTRGATSGANMAIRIATQDMLDQVLSFEHIWPAEDRYLAYRLGEAGSFKQLVSPASMVLRSLRFMPPLRTRLSEGGAAAHEMIRADYINRRAPGVTHYFRDGKLHAYEPANL